MKKFIKKVAAVTGAAFMMGMIGASAASAATTTLDDLPSPFVSNNAYSSVAMVVGSAAGGADDPARTTIKNWFDGFATDTSAGAITSSSDTEKIYFGEDLRLEFAANLQDGQIDGLWDGGVDFRGNNYETHEEVDVNNTNVVWVATSGLTNEEKAGMEPILYTNGTTGGPWEYKYVFDETLSDNLSTDHEFNIIFLGKNFRVSDVVSATNAVTITTGEQTALGQDSTIESDGHTIHIGTIFDTKVEVWVDSESHKFLSEADEEAFYVGGDTVEVKIDDIGYTEDVASRTTLITYGEDISTTVTTGDAVQKELGMPDVDDKAADADWVWDISVATNDKFTQNDYLGIRWNQKVNKYNDEPAPVSPGMYWGTPYNYITLDLAYNEPEYQEYSFEFESSKTINSTVDNDVLLITAEGRAGENDGFEIAGTETDQVAVNASGYVFYYDTDGDWQGGGWANTTTAANGLVIKPSSDTVKSVEFYGTAGAVLNGSSLVYYMDINDTVAADDNTYAGSFIRSNMTIGSQKLGATQGTAEAGDLYYYRFATPYPAAAGLLEVQSWDEGGLLTAYGTKITGASGSEDIKSAIENDELYLWVPEDEAYAEVTFNIRSSGAASEPVLTTESGASGYSKLVLVGGPCVNSLTADYMGLTYKSCEAASKIPEHKAVIKLVEKDSKTALIVAGWDKVDTARAASKLAEATGTDYTVE